MSQLSSPTAASNSQFQKQRLSVYTMMLLISFFAVATACVLLFMELKRYGEKDWWDTSGSQPTSAPTAPAPAGTTFHSSPSDTFRCWV